MLLDGGFNLQGSLYLLFYGTQIRDYGGVENSKDSDASMVQERSDGLKFTAEKTSPQQVNHLNASPRPRRKVVTSCYRITRIYISFFLDGILPIKKLILTVCRLLQDACNDPDDLKSSLASFPIKPLQGLKYETILTIPSWLETFYFWSLKISLMCLQDFFLFL